MAKLNEIVAIEKGVKSRIESELTEMHKSSQKPQLFTGFVKTWRKRLEQEEDFPQEQQKVQLRASELLTRAGKILTELFDVEATKDYANCYANADIIVDGIMLIEKAPVPYLLFLEKQVNDLRKYVDTLPALDEADDWLDDPNTGLHKTIPIATHRTKKVQRPIVLYDATEKHPAQTQLITEDITIGYWDTIKHSGALPLPRKQLLLERIEKLSRAVKSAREAANTADAKEIHVGASIFDYLFA